MVKFLAACVGLLVMVPIAARADSMNCGPVTFGPGSPVICNSFDPTVDLEFADIPPVNIENDDTETEITSFTLDVSPGWAITRLVIENFNPFDPGTGPTFGFEFVQSVTLNALTPSGGGAYASFSEQAGNYPLPRLSLFGGQASPGTGLYTLEAYAHNRSLEYPAQPGTLIIYLAPIPEPSTLALFGTGVIGLVRIVRRRISAA